LTNPLQVTILILYIKIVNKWEILMKLSTRGRYGTRALMEFAHHYGEGPVLLKDVARNQGISLQYLERLMSPLAAAGLIHTTRGVRGGVWLAKPPKDIKLSRVIEAMEGPIVPVDCVGDPEVCDRSGLCASRDVWTEVQRAIYKVLDAITLADLVKRQEKKEACGNASANWTI
jgi:Rrf2 family cysteine metabolism transcriptional repressor